MNLGVGGQGRTEADGDDRYARAEALSERLALPVVLAAVVSVPAVFLTLAEGTAGQVGAALNWLSMLVIVGESVLLMVVSGDIARWVREHLWLVALALLAVPAVALAVGPVQLLRLVFTIGTLRVLRVGRIIRAGRIIHARTDVRAHHKRWIIAVLTVFAAVFVAVTLSDPTGEVRRAAQWTLGRFGVVPPVLAGLVLAAATFVVVRNRRAG